MIEKAMHTLDITINVTGPIVTQGSGAMQYGLDVAILRDANKRPVLPGSLVKGNIRHALSELCLLNEETQSKLSSKIIDWFGKEGPQSEQDQTNDDFYGQRGRLNFDFYWYLSDPQNAEKSSPQTRIELNHEGTIKEGSLLFIESPYLHGEKISIQGQVTFNASEDEALEIKNTLEAALNYCYAFGSFKSIGFGKITEIKSILNKAQQAKVDWPAYTKDHSIILDWTADRPLCMADAPTNRENSFYSRTEITGAMLKGLVANKVLPNSVLHEYLADITFFHAMPLNENDELVYPPRKSLALYDGPRVDMYGVSSTQDPNRQVFDFLINPAGPDNLCGLLTFSSDFKGSDEELLKTPPYLTKTLLVRNAISNWTQTAEANNKSTDEVIEHNISTRNTAADEKLFSYHCVNHFWPEKLNGSKSTNEKSEVNKNVYVKWRGKISLNRVPESVREMVYAELISILDEPLIGLGKTKAILSAKAAKATQEKIVNVSPEKRILITLKTPTCLIVKDAIDAVTPSKDLYQEAFDKLTDGVFCVNRTFTDESLKGGSYWYMRFQKHAGQSGYKPYIETSAGSCFELLIKEGKEKQASILLNQWCKDGLSSCDVPIEQDERWKFTPYDHANGFGEVDIELVSMIPTAKEQAEC